MNVKNGIASRMSLAMIPKTRSGSACSRLKPKNPSWMAMKPKTSPTAARENATG